MMARSSRLRVPAVLALLTLGGIALVGLRHRPSGQTPATNTNLQPSVAGLESPRVEAAYGGLPLSFETNRGQTDSRVKFFSHAGNHTLWLTPHEAVLAVGRPLRSGPLKTGRAGQARQALPAVLRMRFAGANPDPAMQGEARQPGTVNYFAGKPDQWRTKIPTYARVRYRNLYRGIDLVFYGNNRELEYDLVVSPGADPGRIRLGISGAETMRIAAGGNLVLETPAGDVIQQKPKIYQRRGTNLIAVTGNYVISGKDEVGFRLGPYDRRAPVVIDPVLRYSSFLGGADFDSAAAIAVDSSNHAVVAGETCSPDFPVTPGNKPVIPCSVFITKFDFTASRLIFSTSIGNGTIFSASVFGLALDPSNNVYVSGTTSFPGDFPTTPGAFQRVTTGNDDAFAVKLNASGSALIYSTLLGGSGLDIGSGLAVDSAGNAYVTGRTTSADFPTTPGAFQRQCIPSTPPGFCESSPAFVTKLNANGTRALYSTVLGGSGSESDTKIAVDSSGNAYVSGRTTSKDFPTTAGSAQPVFGGGETDGFAAKLSPSGSHLIYGTYLGGSSFDTALAIAVDGSGNAFVTGETGSTNFPVKNAFQPKCALRDSACGNAFVTKLSPSVGRLLYSSYLGGGKDGFDTGVGIAATRDGQAYVSGSTFSSSFPTTQTAFQRVFRGSQIQSNAFLTKFTSAGKLIYSSYMGGSAGNFAVVALDRDTNAYIAGGGSGSDFPVTPGAFQEKPSGGEDAFVAKVVPLCALSSVNRSVTICSPASGSTVRSPVRVIAGTTDITPVKLTQVYLDGKKIYEARLSAINVGLPIAGGTHRLTVQAFDTANVIFKKSITVTVSPQ